MLSWAAGGGGYSGVLFCPFVARSTVLTVHDRGDQERTKKQVRAMVWRGGEVCPRVVAGGAGAREVGSTILRLEVHFWARLLAPRMFSQIRII